MLLVEMFGVIEVLSEHDRPPSLPATMVGVGKMGIINGSIE